MHYITPKECKFNSSGACVSTLNTAQLPHPLGCHMDLAEYAKHWQNSSGPVRSARKIGCSVVTRCNTPALEIFEANGETPPGASQ